jgi:hypothetical protein
MPRPFFLLSRQSPSYLPPPRNIKPQKTPAQQPARPRQSPPRLNTRACPPTTPASRQHHLPPPRCCTGARATPRHHTRPHTLSSRTGTHTPPPAPPASPARRLVLCRGLLLPRPCHDTHAALTWLRRHRFRYLCHVACGRGSPLRTCPHPANIKPQQTPAQAPASPRQSPPRLNTRACPPTTPASRQHHLPPPLSCAGARATPRHHTRPNRLSSLTGTHTPPPAPPASPARRLVLCRGLLLPRPCHDTHAALTCLRWHR